LYSVAQGYDSRPLATPDECGFMRFVGDFPLIDAIFLEAMTPF
jgi:hypothetical protein